MNGTVGFIVLIIVGVVFFTILEKIGNPIADRIVAPKGGMRKTYAHNSVIIAILLAILVMIKANSAVLGIIVFVVVSLGGYVLIRVLENAIDRGVDAAGDKIGEAIKKKKEEKSKDDQ